MHLNRHEFSTKDFSTDSFDMFLEGLEIFTNSSIYCSSFLNKSFSNNFYSSDRNSIDKIYNNILKINNKLIDYIENLRELSSVQVVGRLPAGNKFGINIGEGAYKSAVLLYSLVSKVPFVKDEEEKEKLTAKITIAKALHQYQINKIRKYDEGKNLELWDNQNERLNKQEILEQYKNISWVYLSFSKMISFAETIKEFMKLNNLDSKEKIFNFVQNIHFEVENLEDKDEFLISDGYMVKLNKYQRWYKENIKYPRKNEDFIKYSTTDQVKPSFDDDEKEYQ